MEIDGVKTPQPFLVPISIRIVVLLIIVYIPLWGFGFWQSIFEKQIEITTNFTSKEPLYPEVGICYKNEKRTEVYFVSDFAPTKIRPLNGAVLYTDKNRKSVYESDWGTFIKMFDQMEKPIKFAAKDNGRKKICF